MFRKIYVIAAREYLAVVRSKAFVISLLILPLIMGGSVLIQRAAMRVQNSSERKFLVIDRSPGQIVLAEIRKQIEESNAESRNFADAESPQYVIQTPQQDSSDLLAQRYELSQRIREGELVAFVEIGSRILENPPDENPSDDFIVRWQTNSSTWRPLRGIVASSVNRAVRMHHLVQAGIPADRRAAFLEDVAVVDHGLIRKDEAGNLAETQAHKSQIATQLVPLGLAMLMWMVVVIGSMPLMQGIIEEKQQRIAEVLLGSVGPFVLMAGKVLGLVGTSVTLILVYLGGAYWAMGRFGLADFLPAHIIVWFIVFQILAVLMYGSLYIAIGASCTDTKEMQSLLLPVNLLLAVPIIVVFSVAQNPNGPLARPLTFFPPATPIISIVRLSVPPGMALWETLLAVLLVLATTIVLIWMSGRIFRIGILMQSKGATFGQLVKWAIRG